MGFTLFRNFWWLENVLFLEDLGIKTTVWLSSYDFIIDAQATFSYLQGRIEQMKAGEGENFKIVEMEGLAHGSFLNSTKYIEDIVNCL